MQSIRYRSALARWQETQESEDTGSSEERGPVAHPLSSDAYSTSEGEEGSPRTIPASLRSDDPPVKQSPESPVSVLLEDAIDIALLYDEEVRCGYESRFFQEKK